MRVTEETETRLRSLRESTESALDQVAADVRDMDQVSQAVLGLAPLLCHIGRLLEEVVVSLDRLELRDQR